MKLSTRTRYGIRAMITIAENGGQSPVDLNKISQKQGLSKKYLHALLVRLKDAGLLVSVRGKRGGYLFAKKPNEITLLDVYLALEGKIELVDCLFGTNHCAKIGNCPARRIWRRLTDVMQKELSSITLADVLRGSEPFS